MICSQLAYGFPAWSRLPATAVLFLVLNTSCFGSTDVVVAEIIQDNSLQRPLVFPRLVYEADGKPSLFGPLGPEAVSMCTQFRDNLELRAGSEFEVIGHEAAKSATESFTVDSLHDPDRLARLRRDLEADALVVLTATANEYSRHAWDLKAEVITLETGVALPATRTETFRMTLSGAAYSGFSFEARRWQGPGLVPIGFKERVRNSTRLRGIGPEYQRSQLHLLKPDLTHPLSDGSGIPYGLEILVDNEHRSPERIGDRYYIRLERDETFDVRLLNRGDRDVLVGLYVDGKNSIGNSAEHPLTTPAGRHWFMARESQGVIGGWSFPKQGPEEDTEQPFEVVPRDQVVAADQSSPEYLGMITAIVYTNTLEDIEGAVTTDLVTRGSPGAFAIGAGETRAVEFDFNRARRGMLLAAITLHYNTNSELEQIRRSSRELESPENPAEARQTLAPAPTPVDLEEVAPAPLDGPSPKDQPVAPDEFTPLSRKLAIATESNHRCIGPED